jgi:hypothetical protein
MYLAASEFVPQCLSFQVVALLFLSELCFSLSSSCLAALQLPHSRTQISRQASGGGVILLRIHMDAA